MINLYKGLDIAYETGMSTLRKLQQSDNDMNKIAYILYLCYEASAWYQCLRNNDINQAKNDFYNNALATIQETSYNKDVFAYRTLSALNAALSDNSNVINEFSQIEYTLQSGPHKGRTNKQIAKLGKDHILMDTIIKAMNKDMKGLKTNLDIMDQTFMTLKKNAIFKMDRLFFEGILRQDKDSILKSIETMSTIEHKKRNKHCFYMKDVVSHPAIGYAKIAWMNNIEIEFNNNFISNSLLPISPNSKYINELENYIGQSN